MNNHIKRVLSILPLLTILFFANTHIAMAQGAEGLQVKPAIIEDKVNPGDTYNFTVTVTNISGAEKTLSLSAQDISGLDDQGLPVFSDEGDAGAYALSAWVLLSQESVTLQAGESRTIPFTVRVPNQTSPGAHFGGVFFNSKAQKQDTTGSSVSVKVGTIINLRVAGDVIEEARLRGFSTDKLVYSSPSVRFDSRVENLGNVLARPHGLIDITDMRGKSVGHIEVNDAAAPVFPGAERTYSTQWESDGFAFGRYQAILSLNYGDDSKKTISATTSFWVLPLGLIGGLLGGLLVLVFALWMSIRMYIRGKLRQMGVTPETGADIYAKRYQKKGSRLFVMVFAIILICIAAVAVLFVMFA